MRRRSNQRAGQFHPMQGAIPLNSEGPPYQQAGQPCSTMGPSRLMRRDNPARRWANLADQQWRPCSTTSADTRPARGNLADVQDDPAEQHVAATPADRAIPLPERGSTGQHGAVRLPRKSYTSTHVLYLAFPYLIPHKKDIALYT